MKVNQPLPSRRALMGGLSSAALVLPWLGSPDPQPFPIEAQVELISAPSCASGDELTKHSGLQELGGLVADFEARLEGAALTAVGLQVCLEAHYDAVTLVPGSEGDGGMTYTYIIINGEVYRVCSSNQTLLVQRRDQPDLLAIVTTRQVL